VLSANVTDRSNIRLNQVAVSSTPGVAQLNDLGLVFSGRNSLHRAKVNQSEMNLDRQSAYEIQTTTIDQYCQDTGMTPDVLKIDAESAEFEILQGADHLISEKKPVITLEVGDAGIEGVPTSRELIEYLISQGYKAYEFSPDGISEHKLRDRYEWDNLLFQEA
jgi:FkbM family methyltransferase